VRFCSAANINSPGQIVIAGAANAVDRAMVIAKELGAKRAVRLNVSAPFHCALMMPAQERLAADLERLEFRSPDIPLVTKSMQWRSLKVTRRGMRLSGRFPHRSGGRSQSRSWSQEVSTHLSKLDPERFCRD